MAILPFKISLLRYTIPSYMIIYIFAMGYLLIGHMYTVYYHYMEVIQHKCHVNCVISPPSPITFLGSNSLPLIGPPRK